MQRHNFSHDYDGLELSISFSIIKSYRDDRRVIMTALSNEVPFSHGLNSSGIRTQDLVIQSWEHEQLNHLERNGYTFKGDNSQNCFYSLLKKSFL